MIGLAWDFTGINGHKMVHELINKIPDRARAKFNSARERYGDSWVNLDDPTYLLRRMEEEFYEFRQAVEHYEDPEMAFEELADIINFALMYIVLSFHRQEIQG